MIPQWGQQRDSRPGRDGVEVALALFEVSIRPKLEGATGAFALAIGQKGVFTNRAGTRTLGEPKDEHLVEIEADR